MVTDAKLPIKSKFKLNINEPPTSSMFKSTPLPGATTKVKTETSDGFKTFNEIPVTPAAPPAPIRMNAEETLREKLKLLRALEALEKKGIQLTYEGWVWIWFFYEIIIKSQSKQNHNISQ